MTEMASSYYEQLLNEMQPGERYTVDQLERRTGWPHWRVREALNTAYVRRLVERTDTMFQTRQTPREYWLGPR